MESLMKLLKPVILLTGFFLLFSYTGGVMYILHYEKSVTMQSRSIKSEEGNVITDNFHISDFKQIAEPNNKPSHPNQIITTLPISFGLANAILISN